jgi:hypothetical protein
VLMTKYWQGLSIPVNVSPEMYPGCLVAKFRNRWKKGNRSLALFSSTTRLMKILTAIE